MASQRYRRRAPKAETSTAPRFLNQRNVSVIFFVLAILALVVFGMRSAARQGTPALGRADPSNAAQVAAGQSIYATRCATCHGVKLEGGVAVALDASGPAVQRDDRWIFTTIKEGGQATAAPGTSSAMPALGGGMSDEQIWAVIAFVKSTWPADVRAAQPQAQ